MSGDGWIKLYRKTMRNHVISRDMETLGIFVTLLMLVDKRTGSYTYGTRRLSSLLNVDRSKLLRVLKVLCNQSIIELKANRKYSTIYICNWHAYQTNSEPLSDRKQTENAPKSDTKQEKKRKEDNTYVELASQLRPIHVKICEFFGKDPDRYKLSDKRKTTIKVRLKDVGESNILKACQSVSQSNFHMGENDRSWVADPYWCLSSFEKAEKWSSMDAATGYTGKLTELEI